ncbi:MAG: hypothetical protein SAL07_18550 [Oscillatoria sp. PMC 1051.18]|nr:hypothetical protein [Oscillatoria sp. PMC 1050.18]MEC5031904.1 hypothetical protein [Oscillatoria sp. PMC 1051.18]
MPKLDFDSFPEPSLTDLDLPEDIDVDDLIAELENSHRLRYQMINVETWAIVEAMDRFIPGFWSRFLENRRLALKQFIVKKRQQNETGNKKKPFGLD